jgi:hypothetical protein
MNSLCRYIKPINIDYDLRAITILLCLNFFLLNPNFHIIEDKKN